MEPFINSVNALYEKIEPYLEIFPRFSIPVYNAAAKTAALIISGTAAAAFWPAAAPALFVIAGSIAATRLALNIAEHYDRQEADRIQLYVAKFREKNNYIQIAAVVVVLVAAFFSWWVASLLAIPVGIYAGIVVPLDFVLARQRLGRGRANVPGAQGVFGD